MINSRGSCCQQEGSGAWDKSRSRDSVQRNGMKMKAQTVKPQVAGAEERKSWKRAGEGEPGGWEANEE